MNNKIRKIEILNDKDFNHLIKNYEFDKFSCSSDKHNEIENILRIVIYSNKELFDELANLLSCSEIDFIVFGGRKRYRHYVAIEIYI